MAQIVVGQTGQDTYHDVLETVRRHGRRRGSRNGPTLEVSDLTIALESPVDALPIGVGRGLNVKIAAAEALQLIGGFSDPDWLVKIAPGFERYREPEGQFWGAYGNRIGNQLEHIITKIYGDVDTRQAVITLWDSQLDNVRGKSDYPCTISLGFTSYHEQLSMHVTMRSNDVWLGLPYDMFQFAQLQLTLCNLIGQYPGTYTHTAWSMHIYVSDVEKSYDVTNTVDDKYDQPDGIGHNHLLVEHLWTRARTIAREPHLVRDLWQPTKSEEWYLDTLHASDKVAA